MLHYATELLFQQRNRAQLDASLQTAVLAEEHVVDDRDEAAVAVRRVEVHKERRDALWAEIKAPKGHRSEPERMDSMSKSSSRI